MSSLLIERDGDIDSERMRERKKEVRRLRRAHSFAHKPTAHKSDVTAGKPSRHC